MEEKLLYSCNKLSVGYFNRLIEENIWKAFLHIHSGLHHQIRIFLWQEANLGNLTKPWDKFSDTYFGTLTNELKGKVLDETLVADLKKFNQDRVEKFAHIDVYKKKELSDEEIKNLCKVGLNLLSRMDEEIKNIIFDKKKQEK